MTCCFAFGPLRYAVTAPAGLALDELAPWRDDDGAARPVNLVADPAVPRAWVGELARVVARDAVELGAVVVHAAAVRAADGVVLLLAPGGTGKTTFAANAGTRSFAHNAVLVVPSEVPSAWALPFAGDRRCGLDATGCAPVRALALLERGTTHVVEWIPRSAATIALVRSCAWDSLEEPMARKRNVIALALAARLPALRVRCAPQPFDLTALDHALTTETAR